MVDQRIDVEITDKVSPSISAKLRSIAGDARTANTAVEVLQASLNELNVVSLNNLAAASSRVTSAQAQMTNANARLISANSRLEAANNRTALSQQRLATETARTEAAQSNAATAAARAATAQNNAASSAARAASAASVQTAAINTATAAQRVQNSVQNQGSGISRQYRQQLLNLTYQLNDVVVGLASGQRPLTVLLQQGSQMSTIFGGGNGVGGTLRLLGKALKDLVNPYAAAALVAVTLAFAGLTEQIRKTTGVHVTFGQVFRGVIGAAVKNIREELLPAMKGISPVWDFVMRQLTNATKAAFDILTAPFLLAYNTIVTLFKHLPQALGEVFVATFNLVLQIIEDAINKIIDGVNGYTDVLNTISKKLGGGGNIPGAFSHVTLVQAQNDFTDLNAIVDETGHTFNRVFSDRSGKFYKDIAAAALKAKAADDAKKAGNKPTFGKIVTEYEVEIAGLRQVGEARERILGIGKAEKELNRKLTDGEKQRLGGLIDMVQELKLINDLNQPIIDLTAQMPILNKAYADGAITLDQYNKRVQDLNLSVLGLRNDMGAGFQQGFIKVKAEMSDVATLASGVVTDGFKSAEDAIVSLATTGKVSFKSLIDSMIADLIRLALRQTIEAQIASHLPNSGLNIGQSILNLVPSFHAKGTVLNSPTLLGMNNGRADIGGEAGAEGVLPLRRNSKGQLGVIAGGVGNGGLNVTNNVEVNYQAAQGGNSQQDAMRIQQMVQQGIEQGMADYVRRQQKTGGQLNNRLVN